MVVADGGGGKDDDVCGSDLADEVDVVEVNSVENEKGVDWAVTVDSKVKVRGRDKVNVEGLRILIFVFLRAKSKGEVTVWRSKEARQKREWEEKKR